MNEGKTIKISELNNIYNEANSTKLDTKKIDFSSILSRMTKSEKVTFGEYKAMIDFFLQVTDTEQMNEQGFLNYFYQFFVVYPRFYYQKSASLYSSVILTEGHDFPEHYTLLTGDISDAIEDVEEENKQLRSQNSSDQYTALVIMHPTAIQPILYLSRIASFLLNLSEKRYREEELVSLIQGTWYLGILNKSSCHYFSEVVKEDL